MGRTLLRRDGMRLPGVVGSPRTGDVRDCRMPQVSSARALPRAGRPHETRRLPRLGLLGRPVPGFGDPDARVLVVGLAPAAHGGNRTGRTFTGDRSGERLYRALYRAGFSNQPTSVSKDHRLVLRACYIAAAERCAPPQNNPTR